MKKSVPSIKAETLFFETKPCLRAHVYLLKTNPQHYIQTLHFVCDSGTLAVVSTGVKARILAALHIMGQHKNVSYFLQRCELVDIVKGLSLLDRNRKVRQLQRRIDDIELAHPSVLLEQEEVDLQLSNKQRRRYGSNKAEHNCLPALLKKRRRRAVDTYRIHKHTLESCDAVCAGTDGCAAAHADSATLELIQSASVSGALARKVRLWTRTCLRSDFLEFILLGLPLESWRELADLVHMSPSDFVVPYFLKEVFATTQESDNSVDHNFVTTVKLFLHQVNNGDHDSNLAEKLLSIAQNFPQVYLNYSLFRRFPVLMTTREVMEEFAARAPLDTVVWHFEEFHHISHRCQDIISERLKEHGEDCLLAGSSKVTYGKLVERILTLRRKKVFLVADQLVPVAERRLKQLQALWDYGLIRKKVAVFGDASASMQSAIEAAAIFASMVSVCFDGELSFFRSDLLPSPHAKPCNVHEALQVCEQIRADGTTSLASALWPYYANSISMDIFVMVTDEMENTNKNGSMFAPLLAEYKKTVNPDVCLVVVCVGHGCPQFRKSLALHEINYKVVQVDGTRPDHAKFDALLGQLALLSTARIQNDVCDSESGEFVLV
jgi:hypothetical protein